ncbi:MAG: alanine racemase, partial [Betaproteobacteria bacterium]|nr:alanine racemase [Betaproteobacteria bacterium]
DPVELWGQHVPVDGLAKACGTIGYQLLSGLTARVPRVIDAGQGKAAL